MFDQPGLTARLYFESLSDQDLRRFITPEVLSVLDAVFGGRITGGDLQQVVMTLVDMGGLLTEENSRSLVLSLVPQAKRAELEARIQRSIDSANRTEWTAIQVKYLRDFFGIIDDELGRSNPQGTS